MIKIKKPT